MTRILARATLILALLLGAAGVAVGAIGINDAHQASKAAAADRVAAAGALAQASKADKDAASAQQGATNALDSLATVTGNANSTGICNGSVLTPWAHDGDVAAGQAMADGDSAAYQQYRFETSIIDLVCGTHFTPGGA